jgi:signal transduction histidine kinase
VRNTTRTRPDSVRPRGWPVRTRLNAILLIPVVVALVVGGFNVDRSVRRWQQADDAMRTARLVAAATDYGHALLDERDLSAVPLLAGDTHSHTVATARAATDRAARRFDAAAREIPASPDLRRRLAAFRAVEPRLATLRKEAYTAKLPGVRTEEAYVAIQHPLMEFANELGFGTDTLTSYGRTLYAISLTEAAESLTRSIGTHVLVEGRVPVAERTTQLTALASYAYLENIALQEYQGGGTPQDMARLATAEKAAQRHAAGQLTAARAQARAAGRPFVAPPDRITMVKAIASGASPAALRAKGITPTTWMAAATGAFDAYRTVEAQLAGQAEHDASAIASDAKRDAALDAAVVLLGLLAAFVVATLMARSMIRRMRELRGAALEIAQRRLPAVVDQLSRVDPGRVDTRVEPIPINSGDEMGEVARAFDQVHREAVRLAAEQAMLRGNVNAIFTNLSLRNQGLIERQLSLITGLENNEGDPDQLSHLFELDHLATRMRRNGENLLVLAGQEPGRRWNQPVPLVDVLRAAASEVESYERVEISGVPETEIHGASVTDLVHLLAELLENATSFSSPLTRVNVTATRLPDGRIMVEIHDKGIGLTAEDFADLNHQLADPPMADATVSRRMGLFVVGRLAGRHGIKVQLRPSGEQAGTTCLVMLPEPITHGGGDEPVESDFTVSRIMPEHRPAAFSNRQLTAAELGFDDRRYEVPDDAAALDPVSLSLRRGGRRAALEAAVGDRRAPSAHRPLFADENAVDGRYEQSYAQDYPAYGVSAETIPPGDHDGRVPEYGPGPLPGAPERVGYDAPDGDPAPGDQQWPQPGPVTGAEWTSAPQGGRHDTADRRSTNDELRQRAARTREPQASGVTPAGLPKRVPRANLAPGAAHSSPQTGPQVSRDPEDVRGRLSDLRRGVQQGRGAAPDSVNDGYSPPTDSQGPGPNHQER